MTKSSDASQVIKPSHCFINLHDFLKTKRGIFKYAKRSNPNYNWNGGFEESEGSFWVGDRLLCNSGSNLVFLAKNRAAPTDPNSDLLPTEIVVKSRFLKFSSSLQHEKEVLCNLTPNRNVVRCFGDEITTTKSGETIYNVLLEYCDGSNLKDHITKFGPNGLPESEVRRYTRDLVHGLYHIHCNARYIHGDIKPRNILLFGTEEAGLVAKISHFGLAKKLSPEVLCDEEIRGSWPYASPELGRDGYLDWPADIWALGCVVLEMLTGKPVQSFGKNSYIHPWDYYNDELPEIPKGISSAGRDFIKRCLITSPYKRRPTWLLIKHPFVSL